MPPPRAVLSTPSAQRRSSVRARPGMPRTTWACSVLRSSSSTRPAVRRARRPSRGRDRGRRPYGSRAPAFSKARADLAYDLGVVDVAGGGDDEVRGVVVLLVEAGDPVRGERVDRVDGAEDRAAEGGVAEHGVREQVVHAVARVVLGHRDLFEDDAALGVDVLLRGSASR